MDPEDALRNPCLWDDVLIRKDDVVEGWRSGRKEVEKETLEEAVE